jgi:hypothetical protein
MLSDDLKGYPMQVSQNVGTVIVKLEDTCTVISSDQTIGQTCDWSQVFQEVSKVETYAKLNNCR